MSAELFSFALLQETLFLVGETDILRHPLNILCNLPCFVNKFRQDSCDVYIDDSFGKNRWAMYRFSHVKFFLSSSPTSLRTSLCLRFQRTCSPEKTPAPCQMYPYVQLSVYIIQLSIHSTKFAIISKTHNPSKKYAFFAYLICGASLQVLFWILYSIPHFFQKTSIA